MKKGKNTAIILAAGQGKRMNSAVPKQYLLLRDKPILFYTIKAFQENDCIDEIILVVGNEQIEYCKNEIVDKYNFTKVKKIIEGGNERYLSVFCGIKEAKDADNIFVHDGARPFVSDDIITASLECVKECDACAVGVPVKDTIKVVNKEGYVDYTPERNLVWAVQTPQVFKKEILQEAYMKLMSTEAVNVTDDAMVVEQMLGINIKMVMGSYKNIKITTPEDLEIGELYIR